jgi:DHA1 family multidrug resistance protein-like MFS transporter
MDTVSKDLEKAELDAARGLTAEAYHSPAGRSRSHSSTSSSGGSSISSGPHTGAAMSRAQTQRDLERNPTALSRIATQRSQHSGTVGAGLRSRVSKKPLPEFGAGKPYPPPLPEKEEYVVEFDGPDDPLHPQNWTLKRKYVTSPSKSSFPSFLLSFLCPFRCSLIRVLADWFWRRQ